MEFSTSALIDGVIHLAAFLVVCGALYGFLVLTARSRFERNIFRSVFVVISLVTARLYLLRAEWASAGLSAAILIALSFLLLFTVLKTDLIHTLITPFLLVPLLLGMENVAFRVSKHAINDGITYAEFSGRAQSAFDRSRNSRELKTTGSELRDVARRGLDALASLTTKREMDAMKEDFSRGVTLFAERKEWMDSLTPAEKRAYREEMAAFLAEQGLSEDRYSLKAIRDVNPTNLVVLASLFNELQDDETPQEERIRSIPESLGIIAANLSGVELSGQDLEALRRFSELFARDEIEEAMAKARKDLADSSGTDKLAGVVLAAMVQSKSGLPVDQLVADGEALGFMHTADLHAPANGGSSMGASEGPQIAEVAPEPLPPDLSRRFVDISCPLGIVRIPLESPELEDWIAAAQALEIRGYAKLGNEIAILRQDGSICTMGNDLSLEYAGLRYHFKVISVVKDRVALQADYIEAAAPSANGFY